VKDRVILLEQVKHLGREEYGHLLAINTRDVSHEQEVIDEILRPFAGAELEISELLNEDAEMDFELLLVALRLPFHAVLHLD